MKPEALLYVNRMMRWPPDLWERLAAAVPDGERSQFVREAVERTLRRREAQREKVTAAP